MVSLDILLKYTSMEGHDYKIIVEEVAEGEARLVIALVDKKGKTKNYQGADLTRKECRSLGEHLLSISRRI